MRTQSQGMPRIAAEGSGATGSGDGEVRRQSRSPGKTRLWAVAENLRRRGRRHQGNGAGDQGPQSEAGQCVRPSDRAGGSARRHREARPRRQLAHRAQFRNAAEGPGQPAIFRNGEPRGKERGG